MATDSLKAAIASDSLSINKQDSLSVNAADSVSSKEEEKLKAAVFYTAQDSMVFTSDNMGYLYGDAEIKYDEMGIKGEYITVDMDSSIISATFGLDSLGKEFGLPVFSEGDTEYEMKRYVTTSIRAKLSYTMWSHNRVKEISWPMRRR